MSDKSLGFSPNVYGIETEYSCMVTLPGSIVHEIVGSCHSADVKLGLYAQPDKKGTGSLSSNGINNALEALGIYIEMIHLG